MVKKRYHATVGQACAIRYRNCIPFRWVKEERMFSMIRVRFDAHRLVRQLRKSLSGEPDKWKIGENDAGQPSLSKGAFEIVLEPRTVRLLDAIHVYSEGAEIWLPLIARLRLRTAARLCLIENAREKAKPGSTNRSQARNRTARRRRAKPST